MPTIFFDPRTDTKDVPAHKKNLLGHAFRCDAYWSDPRIQWMFLRRNISSDGVSGYITLCFVAALLPAKIIDQQ
jgi:hypothetical protein